MKSSLRFHNLHPIDSAHNFYYQIYLILLPKACHATGIGHDDVPATRHSTPTHLGTHHILYVKTVGTGGMCWPYQTVGTASLASIIYCCYKMKFRLNSCQLDGGWKPLSNDVLAIFESKDASWTMQTASQWVQTYQIRMKLFL